MLRIDVTSTSPSGKKTEYTFRTNNSGEYLFIGVSENRQICCDGGYRSLRRIKGRIREYLRDGHFPEIDGPYPRLRFCDDGDPLWRK